MTITRDYRSTAESQEAPPQVVRGTVLGILFDGLAISGIVNEFLQLASILHCRGHRVLLDLGYDITLGQILDHESWSPPWIELVRALGNKLPASYSEALIQDAGISVATGSPIPGSRYAEVCQELAALLVATLVREHVDILVIENGTLPDNPLFTEAIYIAISEYGAQRNRGRFVLWRDWDLMWSTEPHLYGKYPFPGVHKPERSDYIQYAVATEWMKRRIQAWAPGVDYKVIPSRFLVTAVPIQKRRSLRSAYSLSREAYLVARCTRVIPQKSIERDLRLFDLVQQRLSASGNTRKVFLFVTGPTTEDVEEFARLCALERTLSIAGQVLWGNGLLPFNPRLASIPGDSNRFSVRDLLAEADLSSFLTSYDYEGFGNPPGEAMASGVPFISTTYELYHDVYGIRGAVTPLLPISRSSKPSDTIPDDFVDWVVQLLTDDSYRLRVITHNVGVCRRYFSLNALERQILEIFAC
jgi:glycosyltransferase involved in cell wall biosynthesis